MLIKELGVHKDLRFHSTAFSLIKFEYPIFQTKDFTFTLYSSSDLKCKTYRLSIHSDNKLRPAHFSYYSTILQYCMHFISDYRMRYN